MAVRPDGGHPRSGRHLGSWNQAANPSTMGRRNQAMDREPVGDILSHARKGEAVDAMGRGRSRRLAGRACLCHACGLQSDCSPRPCAHDVGTHRHPPGPAASVDGLFIREIRKHSFVKARFDTRSESTSFARNHCR